MSNTCVKFHLGRFARNNNGSVTVEFSIILTAIMLVIIMFVSLSIHIATTSEVQQAAHDLTRQALRYIDSGLGQEAVCAALQAQTLETVVAQFTFVDLSGVHSLACSLDETGTIGSVTVSYSVDQSFLERAAGLFGLDMDRIERSAQIVL
ncbi:TadE/TadG family type IV pilus assembly protein [Marinovum sp.]|uniref:TadE/TadG family type IV pilus assembly protein n=1 Tax=Marinovum sp. TaxID=2024839 RepID=UPI002B274ADA|nr:TadE/TadG family type IV pilus assembly protein [Marinovum sp.]